MNIDDLARRAGRDLRDSIDTAGDPDEVVRVVARRRRRRTEVTVIGMVAVVVLIMPALILVLRSDTAPEPTTPVNPTTPAPPSLSQTASPGHGCDDSGVSCHGDRTFTVWLRAPITWTLPAGFEAPYSLAPESHDLVETRALDGRSGVTVAQHAGAAVQQDAADSVPGVMTAEQYVRWVATRGFLTTSSVEERTLDGRAAWTVDVRVRPDAGTGPKTCERTVACHPIMTTQGKEDFRSVGISPGVTGRITAMDVSHAGVVAVWAWTLDDAPSPALDALVESIHIE